MTVGTSALGLLPLLLSEGPGADLMARVAAPLVGGLATSFVVELAVYPAIYMVWRGRGLGDGRVDGPGRDDGP
jgi:Cu(I)/Ag(I) efflux system membrane protein CusA/SilA